MDNLEKFYHFKVICICDTREEAREMEMNLIHKAGVNSLNSLKYKTELLNKSKKIKPCHTNSQLSVDFRK